MRQIKLFWRTVVVCVCLAGSSAQARVKCPRKPKNPAEAKEIARKWWGFALKFYNAKLYKRAMESWICSNKMFSHPLGLFNIAMAAEKGKKYRIALKYYKKYLPTLRGPKQRRNIMGKISLLENKLGIRKPPRPRPPAPRVVPRPRPVVVTRPTPPAPVRPTPPTPDRPRPPAPTPPRVTPALPPGPVAPPQPDKGPAVSPPEEKPKKKRIGLMGILGWTSVSVGAALAGTGVALGVMADQAKKTVTEAKEGTNWKDKLKKPYDNYKKYLTGSLICAGIGAAALAAGTVLVILDRGSGKEKEKEKISAVPIALPNGAMLSIGGRF